MSRPRLRLGPHLAPGIVAVALFGVFATVFLQAGLETPEAAFEGVNVTSQIGHALLNDPAGLAEVESEGFLVAFVLIALVLDAALDGALHLARREEGGEIVSALRSDGGDRK